ncbi:hypothetical protein C8J57DRAFT_1311284 [Mycena rebaudengoi]|nr:hypothetical protein C8J57DRAFT_1311284 [Mycena rebaudengoi]
MASGLAPASSSFSAPSHLTCDPTPLATRGGWDRVVWSNGSRSCYGLFHLSSLRTLRLPSFRTLASPVCVHPSPFSTYQGRVGPGRLVKWLPVLLLPLPPFFFVYSPPLFFSYSRLPCLCTYTSLLHVPGAGGTGSLGQMTSGLATASTFFLCVLSASLIFCTLHLPCLCTSTSLPHVPLLLLC